MSAIKCSRWLSLCPVFVVIGLSIGVEGAYAVSLSPANARPVVVLGQLDIDNDGFPDAAPDSDGDGLPDNFEIGGVEPVDSVDRVVNVPAPVAIRSSDFPLFLLNRPPVASKADQFDTDADGLSDFVEIFGLKFVEDSGNSKLDFEPNNDFDDDNGNGAWDAGESLFGTAEWLDLNMDGLPSIGEFPLTNLFATVEGDLLDDNGNPYVYVLDDCNADFAPETVRVLWNVPPDQQLADALNGCASPPQGLSEEAIAHGVVDDDGDGVPDRVVVAEVSYNLVRRPFDFDGFVFTDPSVWDTDNDGFSDGEDRDPLVNPDLVATAFGSGFDRALAPSADDQDLDNDGLGDGTDFGNDIDRIVDFPSDIAARIEDGAPPDRFGSCNTPTLPDALIEDLLNDDWNGDGLWRLTDATSYRQGISAAAAGGENCIQQLYGAEHDTLFVVGARRLYGVNPLLTEGCQTPEDFDAKACGVSAYNQRSVGLGWQEKLIQAARAQTEPFFPDPRLWAILYAWRMPGFDIDGNGHVGAYENTFSTDDTHEFVIPPCGLCGTGPFALFASCLGFGLLKLVRPGRRS